MRGICNGWEFVPKFTEEFLNGSGNAEHVRLPHTVKEVPLHYVDHGTYQMVCGYRRKLEVDEALRGKRLFLQFDGAAHIATVYVNAQEAGHHRTGYTAFRVEITDLVQYGEENLICVKLDTTENGEVPPFGFVIDYLTYGGLYREAWLDIRETSLISDIFVTTPDLHTATGAITAENADGCAAQVEIIDGNGMVAGRSEGAPGGTVKLNVPSAKVWDTECPNLYTCRVSLCKDGKTVDVQEVKFGFRTAQFKSDGFYLNGNKTFMRGLNRHQCWPYIGYAAPEKLQREDARILKEELGCNAVRTSHYPQSHHFIDECDRLGLLVFTEIPGWQHVGDKSWKEQAVQNTREMVLQYRNHPSIVLWGVRINESMDDDELYRRTNAVAHELDPSRATSGVRYIEKSSLLEDVYAFNDFSHKGDNAGAKRKRDVTPDGNKSFLISEHNGHMFPTKSYDNWERRQEHALRHGRVLNAAMESGVHAGCFGWCMFDYATHKDFGSGDRICYHGVMDAFRNPKLAAGLYASQGKKPVLEVTSSMDIGDFNAGQLPTFYALSNAEEVELYKNDVFVTKLRSIGWKGLEHPPLVVDDTIGDLLRSQEGYDERKADLLHKCLLSVGKKGLAGMSGMDMLSMGYAMVRYGMKMDDAVKLYGKYISNWGGEATVWRFDAKVGGEVVASVIRCPGTKLHLEVKVSHTELTEGNTYDMAALRVRVLDEHGNLAPYAQIPVKFALEGAAELVGPDTVTAEGGMCGTYIRTVGKTGGVKLTVSTDHTEPVTAVFSVDA